MDKQNFLGEGESYDGKFPVSANTFDFIQNQIMMLNQLSGIFGDAILKRASQNENGLISLGGELLPLHYTQDTINYYQIVETKSDIDAQGVRFANARIERYAIGSETHTGSQKIDYWDVRSVADMTKSVFRRADNNISQYFLPIGGIIMWSGMYDEIPENFALCDGVAMISGRNVPDLRGKFIVCSDNSLPGDYYPGTTGGSITGSGDLAEGGLDSSSQHPYNLYIASNADFRPPYYALAFIIRVK